MDSDDDDRYLDEVTRIKKATRLAKARNMALEMATDRQEKREDDEFMSRHYKDEVQRLSNLLKAKDDQLREVNHKLRKLENVLAAEKDDTKGKKTKAEGKHEESQREVSKHSKQAESARSQLSKVEENIRVECDRLLRIVGALNRNLVELDNQSSSKTIQSLLLKLRHGLMNMGKSGHAKSHHDQSTASASTDVSGLEDSQQRSSTLQSFSKAERVALYETSMLKDKDADITDSLFDVCRHLEEENSRLLAKLGVDPTSPDELPPKVKKLIAHYRGAIVRTKDEYNEAMAALEHEREINRGLRHQLRQGQPGVGKGYLDTRGSNPEVGPGRQPHWHIDMSTESVTADLNSLDGEIRHLTERLELAAVKKVQASVSEALGGRGQ